MGRPDGRLIMLEQEIKLPFTDREAACRAITGAGGRLVVSRRLLDDRLYDFPDARLRQAGLTMRTRRDGEAGYFTFKGPMRPGPVKSREELETRVADLDVLEAALGAMGLVQTFRAQKYREEYLVDGAHVTVDDVPCGVFVEIEASPDDIARVAHALGCGPGDYRLESYPTLWRQWCERAGHPAGDMVFAAGADR